MVPATPAVRVPMIPLLHAPHDWQVLDANAGMYSTRYCVQYSCMRLHRRYLAAVAGFAHPYFAPAWPDLMAAAMQRAAERGAGECRAVVCVDDEEKRSLFEGLGFREAGAATDFELAGRAVGAG